MRVFHFSDDPHIEVFTPRAVQVPSKRPPGRDWLNGPLVWAIDEVHQPMYLFPRDCPRILLWLKNDTTPEDRAFWWGDRACQVLAHIEWAWYQRVCREAVFRYELPAGAFEDLHDAGMWVCREPVTPLQVETLADLPAQMRAARVELRIMESLAPLRNVWETSLHASGIRLRHAQGWAS